MAGKPPPPSRRRDFIIRLSAITALHAGGQTLSGCSIPDTRQDDEQLGIPHPRFDYGVASGDPLADRVVLWTHARYPGSDDEVPLRWEVAEDARFRRIVASGIAVASADHNHTVHVDASGLEAGKRYCYRFRHDIDDDHPRQRSPAGWTRTLPAAGVTDVRLAVLSCSNYPAGHFHAYGEAARSDAEYALHLGDFIYEYGPGGYASADAEALGRVVQPRRECTTLDDYRARYAQYRSDPNCKLMSAAMPMIAIWDDHEITDNLWEAGAPHHDDAASGAFVARRDAALQAWYEWMPIRVPDPGDLRKSYRSFDFGGLLALHMLETRVAGRQRQIDLAGMQKPMTAMTTMAALNNPVRSMLGTRQRNWLLKQLSESQATWQVLGQQVLMARMTFPASILSRFGQHDADPVAAQQRTLQAIEEFLQAQAIARQDPAALTPAQQALLSAIQNPRFGYNMDAWDGYPAERETLLQAAHAMRKKLVVLAGDTHNAWGSQLTLADGTVVGYEYATTSISSPGMEEDERLAGLPPDRTRQIFLDVVNDLQYADTSRRGFLLLHVTPEAVSGQWHYVSTVKAADYTVDRSEVLVYRG